MPSLRPVFFLVGVGLTVGCTSSESSRSVDGGHYDGSSDSSAGGNTTGGSSGGGTAGSGGAGANGGSGGTGAIAGSGGTGATAGSGGAGGSGGTGGASDAGVSCPDQPPQLSQYPYTPEACSFAEMQAQLRCEYDTSYPPSSSGVLCRTTFSCQCLSDHMGGVDCYWGAVETICPDGG